MRTSLPDEEFGGSNTDFGFPISPCLTLDPFGVPVPSKEPFPQGPSAGPATGFNGRLVATGRHGDSPVESDSTGREGGGLRSGRPGDSTRRAEGLKQHSPGAPGSKDSPRLPRWGWGWGWGRG